jgi:hypothetical protein
LLEECVPSVNAGRSIAAQSVAFLEKIHISALQMRRGSFFGRCLVQSKGICWDMDGRCLVWVLMSRAVLDLIEDFLCFF